MLDSTPFWISKLARAEGGAAEPLQPTPWALPPLNRADRGCCSSGSPDGSPHDGRLVSDPLLREEVEADCARGAAVAGVDSCRQDEEEEDNIGGSMGTAGIVAARDWGAALALWGC
jgi:hypothetical protein